MKTDPGKALSPLILLFVLSMLPLSMSCKFDLFGGDSVNGTGSGAGSGSGGNEPVFPPMVFLADRDTDGTVELYVSFDEGAEIVKLSGNMVFGGNVVDFQVSPDGGSVAYVADQARDEILELYVVPVDKTANENAVKISGPLMAGSGITQFSWAPDSSRVAYIADQDVEDLFELYTNLPEGGSNLRISQRIGLDRDVDEFAWAPNSQKIAYLANHNLLTAIDLYTALPDVFSSGQQNSSGVAADQKVISFKWSPGSTLIAFIADKGGTGFTDFFRLYTTSPNNSNNILVSGNLDSASDVRVFKWMPNGMRIAYVVELAGGGFELFATLRDIEPSILISNDLEDADEDNFAWAPDSSRIAYIADQGGTGVFELFTSTPDGGTIRLVSDLPGSPVLNRRVSGFQWQPDSAKIAYLADQDIDQKFELYVSPNDNNDANEKVSGTPMAGEGVVSFEWSPDGERIAYSADQNASGVFELFASAPDGSTNDRVSGAPMAGQGISSFGWAWAPDSSAIGYIADQNAPAIDELYASQPDGGHNTRLSGNLVNGGDVFDFEWVP
jgi:Tol biopolymer transport system component